MSSSKGRAIAAWVLVLALALLFLLAALGKLTGAATPMFEAWGYPAWFALLIGLAELAGAIGLLIPKTTRWAVLGLGAIMLGAVFTHLTNGEGAQVLRPLIFLGGLVAIWLLRSPARGQGAGEEAGPAPSEEESPTPAAPASTEAAPQGVVGAVAPEESEEGPGLQAAPPASAIASQEREEEPSPEPAPPGDDLKKVEGIGPKIEGLLNAAGIRTWRELSETPVDAIQGILDAAGPRYRIHDPKSWPDQARLAAEGRWDELQELQDLLIGGRDG